MAATVAVDGTAHGYIERGHLAAIGRPQQTLAAMLDGRQSVAGCPFTLLVHDPEDKLAAGIERLRATPDAVARTRLGITAGLACAARGG